MSPLTSTISPDERRQMESGWRRPSSRLTIVPARPRSMTPAWRSRNAAITLPKSFTVAVALPVKRDRFAALLDHRPQHALDFGFG